MCATTNKGVASPKRPEYTPAKVPFTSHRVWMPLMAAAFHLVVFAAAVRSLLVSQQSLSQDEFIGYGSAVDVALATAYAFDLFCCYAARVVPFSRVRNPADIAGHHLPVLCVFIPLVIPTWKRWDRIEPFTLFGGGVDGKFDSFSLVLQINGFGAISSLNEVIMCLQRAEMSRAGVDVTINHWSKKGDGRYLGFFTSNRAQIFELVYKLAFFVVSAAFSFKACIELDILYYAHNTEELAGSSLTKIVLVSFFRSPLQVRSLLWRLFIFTNYPMMARRTIAKLSSFLKPEKSMDGNLSKIVQAFPPEGSGPNRRIISQ